MITNIETVKLHRVQISLKGEVSDCEFGDWVSAEQAVELVIGLQKLCRKYKGIAGACLSGTDEVERIAAESTHHFEAFDKAMHVHRKRDDALILSLRKLWGPQSAVPPAAPLSGETPRTDAVQNEADSHYRDGEWRQFSPTENKGWAFARQLERELAATLYLLPKT